MNIKLCKLIVIVSSLFLIVILPYFSFGEGNNHQTQMGTKVPEKFLDLWMPFGIAFDKNSNLLVSHSIKGIDGISIYEHVSKYSSTGQLLKTVQTAGLLDPAVVSGNFVLEPSSGKILCLCRGNLVAIDPNTLAITNLFSIPNLSIDTDNIYDVEMKKVNNLLTIMPANASYGDLAVYNRQNSIDLFICGSYAATAPFILRVKMSQNFSVNSARVIVASSSAYMVAPAPSFAPSGIAISQNGTIVTTLPQTFGSISSAVNVLFAFNVNFEPADGIQPGEEPRCLFHKTEAFFNSTGMTCDRNGIFYITTDFMGAFVSQSVCDKSIVSFYNASLVILSKSLDRILDVIYPPTTEIQFVGFDDVIISPNGTNAFVSIFEYTTDPYSWGDKMGRIVYYSIADYTDIELERHQLLAKYQLNQNYPNPFNSVTTIAFSIPENDFVTITIYNMLGKAVTELVNGNLSAGEHQVQWDARDLPTGTYFYRMETSKFSRTMKLNLLK